MFVKVFYNQLTKILSIMRRSILLCSLGLMIFTTSCVSKKKYTEMEEKYENSQSQLYKTNAELDEIQNKVDNYYAKINALQDKNQDLIEDSEGKFELTESGMIASKKSKDAMRKTLQNVDPEKLAEAKTLSDSMDLAVSYNLKQSLGDDEGLDISVDRTVVEITISDNLMFRSGSYRVNPKAYNLLEKIAELAKSEPAIEVLVEGHTDSQTLVKESYIEDNWDLSLRRSASVVRILQDRFKMEGNQLIASGRSSYKPVSDNDSVEGRQKNRRTRIIVLPNLDKFLALLGEQE